MTESEYREKVLALQTKHVEEWAALVQAYGDAVNDIEVGDVVESKHGERIRVQKRRVIYDGRSRMIPPENMYSGVKLLKNSFKPGKRQDTYSLMRSQIKQIWKIEVEDEQTDC